MMATTFAFLWLLNELIKTAKYKKKIAGDFQFTGVICNSS